MGGCLKLPVEAVDANDEMDGKFQPGNGRSMPMLRMISREGPSSVSFSLMTSLTDDAIARKKGL